MLCSLATSRACCRNIRLRRLVAGGTIGPCNVPLSARLCSSAYRASTRSIACACQANRISAAKRSCLLGMCPCALSAMCECDSSSCDAAVVRAFLNRQPLKVPIRPAHGIPARAASASPPPVPLLRAQACGARAARERRGCQRCAATEPRRGSVRRDCSFALPVVPGAPMAHAFEGALAALRRVADERTASFADEVTRHRCVAGGRRACQARGHRRFQQRLSGPAATRACGGHGPPAAAGSASTRRSHFVAGVRARSQRVAAQLYG
jgi:hypothetical protein